MRQIVEVTGTELSELLRVLRSELRESRAAIHTVRVAVDADRVMVKFNEGTWSRAYGNQPSLPFAP